MNKLQSLLLTAILTVGMISPPVFGQGYRPSGNGGGRSENTSGGRQPSGGRGTSAPSNNQERTQGERNRPNNSGNSNSSSNSGGGRQSRPVHQPGFTNRPTNPEGNNRPSNPGNNRPSNPGNNRPSNPGHNRPSNPGHNRPSNPDRDHGHNNHGYRPHQPGYHNRPSSPSYHGTPHYYNGNRHRPGCLRPPYRPYRPSYRPIPRPVMPPHYRPYYGAPLINNVLGLAFGAAYTYSIDYLYDNGYTIDGYDNNTVYLRNVSQLRYSWQDANLNYDSSGRLASMQFINSTRYDDASRFNYLYDELCRIYGPPVTYRTTGNGTTGVWYGRGNQNYVSLEYDLSVANGSVRYYTILSYGY